MSSEIGDNNIQVLDPASLNHGGEKGGKGKGKAAFLKMKRKRKIFSRRKSHKGVKSHPPPSLAFPKPDPTRTSPNPSTSTRHGPRMSRSYRAFPIHQDMSSSQDDDESQIAGNKVLSVGIESKPAFCRASRRATLSHPVEVLGSFRKEHGLGLGGKKERKGKVEAEVKVHADHNEEEGKERRLASFDVRITTEKKKKEGKKKSKEHRAKEKMLKDSKLTGRPDPRLKRVKSTSRTRRASLLNIRKKRNTLSRTMGLSRSKGSRVSTIFGMPLNMLLDFEGQARKTPIILQQIILYLEKGERLKEKGIFRESGSFATTEKLKYEFATPNTVVDLARINDVYSVASLLKLWLRSLPEPLLTFSLYEGFTKVKELETDGECFTVLLNLFKQLPHQNKVVLFSLFSLLVKVASHSEQNKMTAMNLGIVFGPTILRPKETTVDSMINTSTTNVVVEIMINRWSEIAPYLERGIETVFLNHMQDRISKVATIKLKKSSKHKRKRLPDLQTKSSARGSVAW